MKVSLVTLKNVTIPTEHGAWGFLFEPMLLGLLVAPSRAGAMLCLAGLAGFLTRRPAMTALGDLRHGHRYPRTWAALAMAVIMGGLAVAALAGALAQGGAGVAPPLLLALPLGLVFFRYDQERQARSLGGELSGALAMGALAPAILCAGGWPLGSALGPWALLALRTATSIVYVRAQVRRLHGREASLAESTLAHAVVLVLVGAAALLRLVPGLAVAAFALGLARCVRGAVRPPDSARALGWSEMRLALGFTVIVAAGYLLRL